MRHIFFILIAALIIPSFSCKKQVEIQESKVLTGADPSSLTEGLRRLWYGDSIFNPRDGKGNYIIPPVRKPGVPGFFRAIPLGLIYDSISGRININRSETGLRYKMYYLSPAGKKIDSTQLVITGIDYADGIYEISAGQNTAFPIYAANPGLPLPCDDDDDDDNDRDDDDDDGCEFDERDLDDDGTNDIPGANSQGFKVNRNNAVINLKATIQAGALGTNPQNGDMGDFKFYYRLNDLSNRALQDITVRLYYYNTAADIPVSLKNQLKARRLQNEAVNSYSGNLLVSQGLDVITNKTVTARPKRPPLIIIVGYAAE